MAGFYDSIPAFTGFTRLMDPVHYRRVPDDWTIGITDIVQSTDAIGRKQYKSVNTAGASVIAAISNALGHKEFPFVFGGDGASFALPPADVASGRDAMAATAVWVREHLDLDMRIALVPVSDIRSQGHDVLVARYAPSSDVSYAMFAGGGVGWAEAAIKRGEFAIAAAPEGTMPDLTGLSCRFERMPSSRGVVLSLIVTRAAAAEETFNRFVGDLVPLIEDSGEAVSPVPPGGPALGSPLAGLDVEARAMATGPLFLKRIRVLARTLFIQGIMRSGVRVGGFSPDVYMRQLVANTDYRKYDDGLRMIFDCTERLATEIEQRLHDASGRGIVHFGLHRQDAAIMTCFTPSATRSDHIHFIDGADGGYARAAVALKAQQAARA